MSETPSIVAAELVPPGKPQVPEGPATSAPSGAPDEHVPMRGEAILGDAGLGIARHGKAMTAEPGPDPVLLMIERAARDPQVDIAKFEKLMSMRERAEAQRASIAFAEAFAELQPELPTIDRNGRIVIYSKKDRVEEGVKQGAVPIQKTPYATLDDILEALRAPLGEHGFSLRFEHEATADNRIVTHAIVRHRLGHSERASSPPLKHDSTGSKNDVQAVGSAMKYGRRYALMAVLPIVSHAPEDADDDGEAAGLALIGPDEIAYVEQLIRDTESDLAAFLKAMGAASVAALTFAKYKRGIALLNEKKRRAGKAS